jgi:hypothetical protein
LWAQPFRCYNAAHLSARRRRNDGRVAPLEVLAGARGRHVEAAVLHRAFGRASWTRTTDERGFVRVNRWKVYVEAGLPRTPVNVTYWDGKLRAEYESEILAEYPCKWDKTAQRPKAIGAPRLYETDSRSPQGELSDPLWVRDPEQLPEPKPRALEAAAGAEQLRLYLGLDLAR